MANDSMKKAAPIRERGTSTGVDTMPQQGTSQQNADNAEGQEKNRPYELYNINPYRGSVIVPSLRSPLNIGSHDVIYPDLESRENEPRATLWGEEWQLTDYPPQFLIPVTRHPYISGPYSPPVGRVPSADYQSVSCTQCTHSHSYFENIRPSQFYDRVESSTDILLTHNIAFRPEQVIEIGHRRHTRRHQHQRRASQQGRRTRSRRQGEVQPQNQGDIQSNDFVQRQQGESFQYQRHIAQTSQVYTQNSQPQSNQSSQYHQLPQYHQPISQQNQAQYAYQYPSHSMSFTGGQLVQSYGYVNSSTQQSRTFQNNSQLVRTEYVQRPSQYMSYPENIQISETYLYTQQSNTQHQSQIQYMPQLSSQHIESIARYSSQVQTSSDQAIIGSTPMLQSTWQNQFHDDVPEDLSINRTESTTNVDSISQQHIEPALNDNTVRTLDSTTRAESLSQTQATSATQVQRTHIESGSRVEFSTIQRTLLVEPIQRIDSNHPIQNFIQVQPAVGQSETTPPDSIHNQSSENESQALIVQDGTNRWYYSNQNHLQFIGMLATPGSSLSQPQPALPALSLPSRPLQSAPPSSSAPKPKTRQSPPTGK